MGEFLATLERRGGRGGKYTGPVGREKLMLMAQEWVQDGVTGCWLWPGCRLDRYAQVMVDGKNLRAHRAMYELLIGPIPPGLVLDHLCLTKACVNPDCLDPVTGAVNTQRAVAAGLRPARNRRRGRLPLELRLKP